MIDQSERVAVNVGFVLGVLVAAVGFPLVRLVRALGMLTLPELCGGAGRSFILALLLSTILSGTLIYSN